MKKLAAKLGIFILKLLGLTPFWLLYFISDIIFICCFYLIRYRKKTVMRNLKNSFPEKSNQEIKLISRQFYRHFGDLVVETIKAFQMSEDTFQRRFNFINPQVLNQLYEQGKSVALLSGHYGNWEWTIALPKLLKHRVNVIYRPIQDETFDEFMKKSRSRFGMKMMAARISGRTMLEHERSGIRSVTYYLTDQTALKDTDYWMMFLNQETAVFPGAEIMASKFGQAVVFMNIQKVRRGYYEVVFTRLFDDASTTERYEVTKTHTKFLEEIIRKRPELWLWSHKRWKHKRPSHIPLK